VRIVVVGNSADEDAGEGVVNHCLGHVEAPLTVANNMAPTRYPAVVVVERMPLNNKLSTFPMTSVSSRPCVIERKLRTEQIAL
jgi:hypothetical protein